MWCKSHKIYNCQLKPSRIRQLLRHVTARVDIITELCDAVFIMDRVYFLEYITTDRGGWQGENTQDNYKAAVQLCIYF